MPRREPISDAAERRLQRVGQRWTPARRALVSSLVRQGAPVTVPELAEAADVPVSSVYRNLAVLESAGIVHRIETAEHARYELTEDLSDHHHHHLICSRCGAVEDFEPGAAVERRVVDALARAARRQGWAVEGHRLDVVGRCPDCAGA